MTVPPTTKAPCLKKKRKSKKKKKGPQCHLLLRPSALSGTLMTHPSELNLGRGEEAAGSYFFL